MAANSSPPAIFVMGPTASGKTDLAIELSKHLPCDIISVDSALVYKGMNIGTAKPDAATLARYPHRLVDIRDPGEPYSAANFREDALREMADISAAGRIPLLVGGTMLYFKVLLGGLSELPEADPVIRAAISRDAEENGWATIHRQLAQVDPQAAERINPNDPQRLQRALEVYLISGVSMTQWHERDKLSASSIDGLPYRVYQLALLPQERSILHERIAVRFRRMLEQGLIDEVRVLRERGDLHKELPSIRAVGYRQVWEHLDGDLAYEEMIERGIIATRQLAKRQFTWLRSWPGLFEIQTDLSQEERARLDVSDDFLQECVPKALNFLRDITI